MAPKKGKKQGDEDQEPVQNIESGREPSPFDPYKGLRFVSSPREPTAKRKQKTTKIPVMKKRPSHLETKSRRATMVHDKGPLIPPTQPSIGVGTQAIQKMLSVATSQLTCFSLPSTFKDKAPHNYMLLDPRAAVPPPLTRWVAPGEAPLNRPPPVMLQRRPPSGRNLRILRKENFLKEAHSLAHYEQVKRQQLALENHLMKKVNRRRGSLLLRQHQVLPRIEPDGYEKAVVRLERCETPPPEKLPVLSFFNYGSGDNTRQGMSITMTRRQRGHNVITDWLGTPHVTDAIVQQLGLLPATDQAVKRLEEEQTKSFSQLGKAADGKDAEFVPLFPALAVVGVSYGDFMLQNKMLSASKSAAATPRSGDDRPLYPHHNQQQQQQRLGVKSELVIPSEPVSTENLSGNRSPQPRQAEGVVLYFGDNRLSWCLASTERAQRSYTVEIGSTAELGRSAVSSTTMRNAGSVAITYSWMRCERSDAFALRPRYGHVRFAFDCWGGVILPGETHRVPCLYKATDPGYFSEDWRLVTRPVLEAGAPVILRLWGITRQIDTSRRDRDGIERRLRTLITRSLAAQRVEKIVDHLPLKEVPLKDTRFPLVHLGPDLFHMKNPGFKYRSASVYRLSRMVDVFDNQLARQIRPQSSSFHGTASLISDSTDFASTGSELDASVHGDMDAPGSHGKAASAGESNSIGHGNAHGRPRAIESDYIFHGTRRKMSEYDVDMDDFEEEHFEEDEDFEEELDITDEFSPQRLTGTPAENIAYLMKVFKRKTNLDRPTFNRDRASRMSVLSVNSHHPKVGEAAHEAHRTTTTSTFAPHHKSTVNIVDPNFQVDTLRRRILDNSRIEIQEAAFGVMTEEVTKICFRTHTPKENWKQITGFTCLCYTIDSFSSFVDTLKEACCQGQLQEELAKKRALEEQLWRDMVSPTPSSNETLADTDKAEKPAADQQEMESRNANNYAYWGLESDHNASNDDARPIIMTSSSLGAGSPPDESKPETLTVHSSTTKSALLQPTVENQASEGFISDPEYFMERCMKKTPREVFTPARYKDQYHSRLYTRMYQLLGDFIDTIDGLWTTETVLKMDQEELGFTRIRDIGRGAKIEELLDVPLPPKWIKMAQRMDTVASANKRRIRSASGQVPSSKSREKVE